MSTGLCSVLKNIRGSMDSDSDSDNDHDVTDDVDPPSWHGSMQHLTSTSESEAGNCSSESFLCDHCGRPSPKGDNSQDSNHSRTSGRPPFPSGRKRGVRPKKRAHFAVDTDNSSDADKMSDTHEGSPCSGSNSFKPISGPSQMVLSQSRRGSLSPREIKAVTSSDNNNRPSPSFTRPSSLSTSTDRGRLPFKANHELFKLPPSGPPASSPTSSGKPALPPRQINRNHFKFHRRNSISNDERKSPLHGKPDGTGPPPRPLRCASATREINSRSNENNRSNDLQQQRFENKLSYDRLNFTNTNFGANSPGDERSMTGSNENTRQLPNYDEALQRVSLLRWASLQKPPTKSSGENQHLLSPEDCSRDRIPQTSTSNDVSMENGLVGERVKCFESKTVSFSSGGSDSTNATTERNVSNSYWNPPGVNKHNSDWLRTGGGSGSRNNHNNSQESDYDRKNPGMNVVIGGKTQSSSNSSSLCNHTEYSGDGSAVFRLRRDDSSTLSDDVFANDDSRENFADISWSPVILSEEKSSVGEKMSFPLGHTNNVAAPINSLAPPLPPGHRSRFRSSSNNASLSNGTRRSASIDRSISNNIVNISTRNSINRGNSIDIDNNNCGDNNNPPSLPNGKRIVLEVLV